MADYLTTDTELTSVADAIREKGGTSAALAWPSGYVDAIDAIETGGGGTEAVTVTLNSMYFTIGNIAWVDASGSIRTDYETEMGMMGELYTLTPVVGSMLVARPSGLWKDSSVPRCTLATSIVISGSGAMADRFLIYKVTG